MKTKSILALVLGITLFACNNSSNEKASNFKAETTTNEETHSHNKIEPIVLNDGEKWVVVPEMMLFIRDMENGVIEFSAKENPSSDEYQELAVLIDQNIRDLTSNCTMEGQAHDELHKWLVPFIELSVQFDAATDLEEQKDIYEKFNQSYKTFNRFFK